MYSIVYRRASKAPPYTAFLTQPTERLRTQSRRLRLLVSHAISELARGAARPNELVLLMLDEFAALGRPEALEQVFGRMVGYGLEPWPIPQDLHQRRSVYGERAGTFLSNAGLIQLFNDGDVKAATLVSKPLAR